VVVRGSLAANAGLPRFCLKPSGSGYYSATCNQVGIGAYQFTFRRLQTVFNPPNPAARALGAKDFENAVSGVCQMRVPTN
jgi:hypothetical protein